MKRLGLLSAVYRLASLNLNLIVLGQTLNNKGETASSLRAAALKYYDEKEFERSVAAPKQAIRLRPEIDVRSRRDDGAGRHPRIQCDAELLP